MKLFLSSEDEHPETIEKLKTFIGADYSNKKIAYVVTASNGELYGAWKESEALKRVSSIFPHVTFLELEEFDRMPILQIIKSCQVLWISGGMPGYLLYWIRRSGLEKELPQLFEQGMIFVGSSAGSMACSKTQNVSEWYLGEPEIGAKYIPGLGLIDFEIYPHYQEEFLLEIKKHWRKGKLALLKDGEVITKVNDKITWLGEECWLEI
jgi:dipeptidase E